VGEAARKENSSAVEPGDVPDGVVTVISTVVAATAGATAVIDPSPFTMNPVAAVAPKETAVAPTRFVPWTVTAMPPDSGPELGAMLAPNGFSGHDG
jgi:hypothetical protein